MNALAATLLAYPTTFRAFLFRHRLSPSSNANLPFCRVETGGEASGTDGGDVRRLKRSNRSGHFEFPAEGDGKLESLGLCPGFHGVRHTFESLGDPKDGLLGLLPRV